jgi:hypothetical protein
MSNDKPDWLNLAREAYTTSTTYFDASIRRQAESDIRQFQGQHPVGSKYLAETGRSKLFRPKTRTTIRKNEAVAAEAFFTTTDVVAVAAQDDNDDNQRASAAIMQELIQYRLTKTIPWFQTVIGGYQDALSVGIVASYQCWEFDAKRKIDRPSIELVPIENLRFDPAAKWTDPVGTSPYIIHLIPMYVKDVKARMKAQDAKTGEPKWLPMTDEQISQGIKQYGDSTRLQREQGRTDSKDQTGAIGDYNIVWVHRNIISEDGDDYLYYTLGTVAMLSKPVPLEAQYSHGKRPYVIGNAIIETHKQYPSSLAKLGKDVQAEINDLANLRIDNVRFALNKRYFVKRNKQVDLRSLVRNQAGSVTLMDDPKTDVETVEFNDVTGSSYQEQDRLNLDFDDVTGSFSGASVQSNRKLNETVGGMQLLDGSANQVSGYQLRTFVETWVEPVLRQLVLLEQYYETDEVILALAGKKAGLMQKFGISTVTDELLGQELTLNVNVGMGATNPTDQMNKFTQGMAALKEMLADGVLVQYGLKVEEVITELFGKLGFRDGSRFFDLNGQEPPEVAALKQQLAQAQQQIAQKTDPRLVEAQIRKIDSEIESMKAKDEKELAAKIKLMVEAQFSAMQSAEVLTAVPGVAPVADALMVAAGAPDPNFIAGDNSAGAIGIEPVKNKRTGTAFTPGGAVQGDTSPNTPAAPASPASPGVGAAQGIETMAADSTQKLMDGGVVGEDDTMDSSVLDDQALADSYANGGMVKAYADGGMIQGPGTATSDSIPATVAPTGAPAAVSAGEFHMPQAVVDAVGVDFFQGLIQQYHKPVEGEAVGEQAAPGADPMQLKQGDFIIPADVVEALGPDFFEELMKQYGGAKK